MIHIIFGILQIILIAGSDNQTTDEFEQVQYHYELDSLDASKFGFIPYESPMGVGPRSIVLAYGYAFIIDDCHHNIKRVDLKNGALKVSKRLSSRIYPWPRDIVEFMNNILVTDDFDSLFVFDTNLNLIETKFIGGRFGNFLFRSDGDSIFLYIMNEHSFYVLNKNMELTKGRDTSGVFPEESAHGRKFSIKAKSGEHYLQTEYYTIQLEKPYFDVQRVLNDIDAINLDYDSTGVVFFDINKDKLDLYYYKRRTK